MKNNILVVIDASSKENFDKLTIHRMPGALPFAGKYRLIDFALSNCKNASISNVAIFPYGNYRSLQDHIGSGKRWDLDRRRDGLFILPPKNLAIPTENMLTFQRMHEHLEYFKRSTQDIVFIMPANIVWNIDINNLVLKHIMSEADVSEIMHENIRLKAFIIEKKKLLSYVLEYDALPYQTMNDLILKAPSLKVNTIKHKEYTRFISDSFNYMKANLDMLRFDTGRTIFSQTHPIYSKEKPAPPAKYLDVAKVSNAMIASGSFINGEVKNAIVGRDVTIKKNAKVENSIIMSNTVIEEDAHVNYAILDKGTIVKRGTFIEGSLRDPYVSQKEQIITNQTDLNILLVASESKPFIKTGGLADVVNDLSRNLVKEGVKTSVILPLFTQVKKRYQASMKKIFSKIIYYHNDAYKIRVHEMDYKNVNYYFIEYFKHFERENVYGYDDDCTRFAFFNLAVVEVLDELGDFDLLHLHDWHVSLIPLLIKQRNLDIKTLLTIHNIDYQGQCGSDIFNALGIDMPVREDRVIFLEQGILHASKISTVSKTYRDELRYDYYGKNLTYAILKRERDFYGILNGISSKHNPQNDKLILSNYTHQTLFTKRENKLFLQKENQINLGINHFLIGMVTRITEQKGFELIIQVLDDFLNQHQDAEFVLLGTGDEYYIDKLKAIEAKYPNRMHLNIGFDATIPNYIYAGADVFLMPSRVEPCGLSQMIAMKYGTIPIVRQTGGLNDTVTNYDPITHKGTGFSFYNFDAQSLKETLENSYRIYKEFPHDFKRMQVRGMRSDFSLQKQAQKMIELYQMLIQN